MSLPIAAGDYLVSIEIGFCPGDTGQLAAGHLAAGQLAAESSRRWLPFGQVTAGSICHMASRRLDQMVASAR